jgi:hypothetical protein
LVALPDGRLASASSDNSLRLWDLKTGVEAVRLAGHTRTVTSLAVLRSKLNPVSNHPVTLRTRSNVVGWTGECGDARGALRLFQALLPNQRVLGSNHPDTLTTRHNVARRTGACGDAHEALRLSQALLADRERVLGPHHPDTLRTRETINGLKQR